MKSKLLIVIMFLATILLAQNFENDLMPMPKSIEVKNGKFLLDKNFTIGIKGDFENRIFDAATYALRRLDARTGMFFQQDFITKSNNPENPALQINILKKAEVKIGVDESYQLNISGDKIIIDAVTDIGAMYGLETLLQLLNSDETGYYFPNVLIKDKPEFMWRGLMIDCSRHFMPVDVIKRNLDAMRAVKVNVFHWHLSDDQGVRVESKVFPQIQQLCSDGLFYTQAQIKDIINYANDRGIRIVPEFDIPGHATSWFAALPELASAPGPYKIERNWGIFDPTFDPTNENTYEFFDKFLGEMSQLFNDDYFHIGGDENNGNQWNANENIQKLMKEKNIKDNHQLQAYFNNRILSILTKYGKKLVGWDEILHPEMPTNIVIQSWRGKEALIKAAQSGYMGILSNGFYIDLVQPADFHYKNFIIANESNLTDEERSRILGAETTMWAELVTPETIDSRIWPRTAAIAERMWCDNSVNDVDDMYRRLNRIEFLLEEHGLLHLKNYEMMLRRLTNNNDIVPLKILVDVVEPLEGYTRHSQGVKYQQHSPYTRVVDAARPDSKTAREFSMHVNLFLKNRDSNCLNELKSILQMWKSNHINLTEIIKKSPILHEILPLANNLYDLSEVGLEALQLISSDKKADVKWLDKANSLIQTSKKSYGQVELKIVEPIELMIKAAK